MITVACYQEEDQHRNARATAIQKLNPGVLDQRQSIKPQPTLLNILGMNLH